MVLTTLDPIKLTEYAIVLSAAALPLTYLPLLIVANDPAYLGDKVNSRLSNAIASLYLAVLVPATGPPGCPSARLRRSPPTSGCGWRPTSCTPAPARHG